MRTISELLVANLHDVFGNRDAVRRAAMIDEVYAEDIVFTDPEGSTRGRAAVAAKTAELLDGLPAGFRFTAAGPQYLGVDQGALAWELGPEGAPPAARGVDVITVDAGRITSLLTLLTP